MVAPAVSLLNNNQNDFDVIKVPNLFFFLGSQSHRNESESKNKKKASQSNANHTLCFILKKLEHVLGLGRGAGAMYSKVQV